MRMDAHYFVDAVRIDAHSNTRMNSADIIKALEADGRRRVAQKVSHVELKHATKAGRVTIPHPRKDMPTGTVRSIERQSGLSRR